MALAKRFEDLDVWKKARSLTRRVYGYARQGAFAKDFGLRDQIQRASVSMMTNIAEGHGHRSQKQFAHFLEIARASGTEVQSLLYIVLDANYIRASDFESLYQDTEEIISMIAGLQRYLRAKK